MRYKRKISSNILSKCYFIKIFKIIVTNSALKVEKIPFNSQDYNNLTSVRVFDGTLHLHHS